MAGAPNPVHPKVAASSDDPTSLFLRRALLTALRLTIVPLAVGSGACDPPIDVEGFARVSCDPVEDLMPIEDVEYVSLRRAENFGEQLQPRDILSESGKPCEKASDRKACLTDLASTEGLIENNVGVDHGVTLYVTTTRGDEVKRYDTPDKLEEWLGKIDTPNEAVLIASLLAYQFDCRKKQNGAVKPSSNGFALVGTKLTESCPVEVSRFRLNVSSEAKVRVDEQEVVKTSNACIGRRPVGLKDQPLLADLTVGEFFARVAHLEAASVQAFRRLARALAQHGAPTSLIIQARQAARDEIRHARDMRRIALRFDGRYESPVIAAEPLPSLYELALDNASEGCVRETFGALFGMFQATQAQDLDIRRTMARVAVDESRHASLALQIAQWVEPLLSSQERERLSAAKREAVEQLARELSQTADDATLCQLAGVPTKQEARALLTNLSSELWPQAHAA